MIRRMEERYREETLRITSLLKTIAKEKRMSIRSIEQKTGQATSIFHRVLRGDVNLFYRHVLMLLDAMDVSWAEFFQKAYPAPPRQEAPDLETADDASFEERVISVLTRKGLIPAGR